MSPVSLGKVVVAAAGTPVQLSSTPLPCSRIRFSVIAGLGGKCYVGTKGMNAATFVGVIKELWPNAGGGVDDSWEIAMGTDANLLNLQDYWIDVGVSGEGLIVTYWKGV